MTLWRTVPPAVESPGEPRLIDLGDPDELVRVLRELRTGEPTEVWFFDVPGEMKWSDVEQVLDCLVAAGIRVAVPVER